MREAMLRAELGDDVFGEDPTVNALEERMAALFGHESALFCPSGTMTNQIAINVHTRPGDEVLCEEGAHVYRYEGGGTYGNHIDNALFALPGTASKLRSDVSTTVFLSNPDEYEGGELVIEDTFGHQSVKLAAGDAIVYPGTSLHRVNPVAKGTRYGSFFWAQSLISSAEKRRLLFDLDQSIQALTADCPAHPKISPLSGTYHTLLRMWSQT